MGIRFTNIFLFSLIFLVFGCAVEPTLVANPTLKTKEKRTLVVFSAPWCTPCKAALAGLKEEVPKELGLAAEFLEVVVYVVSGSKGFIKPTEEIAANYKKSLNSPFAFIPDLDDSTGKLAKWPMHQKYFKEYRRNIPAALIWDENEDVVELFPPSNTFTYRDMIDSLTEHFIQPGATP